MLQVFLAIAGLLGPAIAYLLARADQRHVRSLLKRDLELYATASDPHVLEIVRLTIRWESEGLYLSVRLKFLKTCLWTCLAAGWAAGFGAGAIFAYRAQLYGTVGNLFWLQRNEVIETESQLILLSLNLLFIGVLIILIGSTGFGFRFLWLAWKEYDNVSETVVQVRNQSKLTEVAMEAVRLQPTKHHWWQFGR